MKRTRQHVEIMEDLKKKGNVLYGGKMFAEAADIYTNIIEEQKTTHMASMDFMKTVLCNRGACYLELGQYQSAILDLSDVLGANPTSANHIHSKAFYRLARCFFEMGHANDALNYLDNYAKLKGSGAFDEPSTKELQTKIARASTRDNSNLRIMFFQVHVLTEEADPDGFVREDMVPIDLCLRNPHKERTLQFLATLTKKYDQEVMRSRPWKCWKCRRPATSMTYTPSSYLHNPVPMVIVFARPVCINNGPCDMEARNLINDEMAAIGAQA